MLAYFSPLRACQLALGLLGVVSAGGGEVGFNRDVRPILSENCFPCHGQDAQKRGGELRLDQRDEALAAREGGAAIVAGNAGQSGLLKRVRSGDPEVRMPPPESHLAALKPEQVRILEDWINQGAKYEPHWAFVAPEKPTPPAAGHPVDAFIRARLAVAGLAPNPPADPATQVRRVFLDLTGLPPTPADIDGYLADAAPDRWNRLVDKLLASPHCAERLAMPWLDAARFADTNGFSIDDHRDAWGWRDWVIHAFQKNQPFDEFLTDQLAGDLIPGATPDQRAATGFLRNSMNTHEGGIIPEEYRVAQTADKVDAVASTMLGLTLKCAQCHDHKFDPISQKEYYQFYGFFNTSSEPGMGATNGSTPPVMEYTSPLAGGGIDGIKKRIAELEYLQVHPTVPVVAARTAWEARQPAAAGVAGAGFPWAELVAEQVKWLWAGQPVPDQPVEFRRELVIAAPVREAWMFFTCDDQADVSVNSVAAGKVTLWSAPAVVKLGLVEGRNLIEVSARNHGGPGGFLAVIAWRGDAGWQVLASDASWQARLGAQDPWQPALEIAAHGAAPWGDVTRSVRGPAGDLAEILALPPAARSPGQWQVLNEAFMASGDPLAPRMAAVLASLKVEIDVLAADVRRGRTTVMVMDHQPELRKTHILSRGAYDQPAEEVVPGVPAVLPPLAGANLTRLDLARWLTQPRHPLTSRVAVNRMWQMIFGRGIVETPGDFGNQGSWPTHPELLDWLAVEFTDHQWDLHHLLRTILTSETYRQSAAATPAQHARDPRNLLLARSPRTRLAAETVRDAALAAAGVLDPALGGPGVHPDQPELWSEISHFGHPTVFTAQHYYPGRGGSLHRRSLYTFWKRTSPPPVLGIFDAPTRETCAQVRGQTNTPLQALVLLNSPEFVEAAAALARRMLTEGGTNAAQRIAFGFRLVTGRAPAPAEQDLLERALARHQQKFAGDPAAARALAGEAADPAELAAYSLLGSTMLNLDEAICRP
jgi:hypothetical protein